MFEFSTPRRNEAEEARPQLATEVLLNLYVLACVAALARLLLRIMAIDDRLWIGSTVYRLTNPVVWPLAQLPGAGRTLLGEATLPDLTLIAVLILIPLFILSRPPPRGSR